MNAENTESSRLSSLLPFAGVVAMILCMSHSLARFILIALTVFTVALGGLVLLCITGVANDHLPLSVRIVIFVGFIAYAVMLPVLWHGFNRRRADGRFFSIGNYFPTKRHS